MPSQKLSQAPLLEAILEIRWKLVEQAPGVATDPKYKVLVGRLYDRLEKTYPFHEPLPTSSMPDEMLGYIVQHRFRTAENQWPLVQVGPGVVTLNETENYNGDDFEKRSRDLFKCLLDAYPDAAHSLTITSLQLRYIDAVLFDFDHNDIFSFMADNLKIAISWPQAIFQDAPIKSSPAGFHLLFDFPTTNPKGVIRLRFARGTRQNHDALIWETIVQSNETDIPEVPDGFEQWLTDAHTLTHNLFFKLIEGPLEASFR
jgi:uncharacterized protein (TIGR04255 family)